MKHFDVFRESLNDHQIRAVLRMLDEGLEGFEGSMSAGKYGSIATTSKPTTTRDLQSPVDLGALVVTGGGRSARYWLPFRVGADIP